MFGIARFLKCDKTGCDSYHETMPMAFVAKLTETSKNVSPSAFKRPAEREPQLGLERTSQMEELDILACHTKRSNIEKKKFVAE